MVSPIDPRNAKDEAMTTLVDTFLRRRNEDVQRIREALAAKSFDDVARIGHNLRGNGASYGFAELSVIGEAIENGGVACDGASVVRGVERLTTELARIETERARSQ